MYKFVVMALLPMLIACDLVPEKVTWDDPRIAPMLKAIEAVDRSSLGFTPIQPTATVALERRPRGEYDVMLHIYGKTSRTIAFRKVGTEYKWIHEQEIHTGPKNYETVDGALREKIVITFGIERVSGDEPNALYVTYWGDDPRLDSGPNLALKDVQPVIEEWARKP